MRSIVIIFSGLAAVTLGLAVPAARADSAAGRAKAAQSCVACHGPLGIAAMPNTPNLAGQPDTYIAEQLKAYRSGKRVHEIMSLMAKPLSDADIVNLADWYSSVQLEAKEKP
jgi:cytochrome c553